MRAPKLAWMSANRGKVDSTTALHGYAHQKNIRWHAMIDCAKPLARLSSDVVADLCQEAIRMALV